MGNTHGFALTRERDIPEISSLARFYRHTRTGAELLSLVNDDENKVFGVDVPHAAEGLDRRRAYPRAFGAVRLAQISGQGRPSSS